MGSKVVRGEVQDVSHRTGQRVRHTSTEVTEKHKDMAAGRGRKRGKHQKIYIYEGDLKGDEEEDSNKEKMKRIQS